MATSGLTVSMIVRDERRNLAELLPGLRAAVDDLVIVDTGSVDGTLELARELGARVFERAWDDDFAAARNRGLAEIRTSHVLWLDADDRIDPDDLERIREAIREDPARALQLLLVNESADPSGVTSCWQLRVFPVQEARFRWSPQLHCVHNAATQRARPQLILEACIAHPQDAVLPGSPPSSSSPRSGESLVAKRF